MNKDSRRLAAKHDSGHLLLVGPTPMSRISHCESQSQVVCALPIPSRQVQIMGWPHRHVPPLRLASRGLPDTYWGGKFCGPADERLSRGAECTVRIAQCARLCWRRTGRDNTTAWKNCTTLTGEGGGVIWRQGTVCGSWDQRYPTGASLALPSSDINLQYREVGGHVCTTRLLLLSFVRSQPENP